MTHIFVCVNPSDPSLMDIMENHCEGVSINPAQKICEDGEGRKQTTLGLTEYGIFWYSHLLQCTDKL